MSSKKQLYEAPQSSDTHRITTEKWHWDINQLLHHQNMMYALLVLNRPVAQNKNFLTSLWNNAYIRITVDGGTTQWHNFLAQLPKETQNTMKLPDFITGDFDSISDEIMDQYKKKGCKIIHTPDQNYTDFTKALMQLNEHCQQNKLKLQHVIAIGQSSGRLDQILGNIQTLFLTKEKELLGTSTCLYLMSDDALSWLLEPGEHVISIPEDVRSHNEAWCSLVPVGETCKTVTTSGLKWDLENTPLKFGNVVSTSNTYSGSDVVNIKCSHTLLWSMKIPSLLDN